MAARFGEEHQKANGQQDCEHIPAREGAAGLLDGNRNITAHRWHPVADRLFSGH
jgi:hypothetical protein